MRRCTKSRSWCSWSCVSWPNREPRRAAISFVMLLSAGEVSDEVSGKASKMESAELVYDVYLIPVLVS